MVPGSEWASIKVALTPRISGPAGAAPSAHACSPDWASADHSPAIPRGSLGSSWAEGGPGGRARGDLTEQFRLVAERGPGAVAL
jgi:hypothetical protein